MNETFTIAIATGSGDTIARARVEIDGGVLSLAEVQATTGDYEIPDELAHVDFQLIIHTVQVLTGVTPAVPLAASAVGETIRTDTPPAIPAHTIPHVEPHTAAVTSAEPVEPDAVAATHTSSPDTHQPEPTTARQEKERDHPGVADMPSDFGVNYWRLGTITKVARHYDVPHHVAKGWIKALQDQRQLSPPWPSKQSRPIGRR